MSYNPDEQKSITITVVPSSTTLNGWASLGNPIIVDSTGAQTSTIVQGLAYELVIPSTTVSSAGLLDQQVYMDVKDSSGVAEFAAAIQTKLRVPANTTTQWRFPLTFNSLGTKTISLGLLVRYAQ